MIFKPPESNPGAFYFDAVKCQNDFLRDLILLLLYFEASNSECYYELILFPEVYYGSTSNF